MMQMSRRARRMERHHEARKRPSINLVSLMDIFTILVFFLLVSSSTVQQLPSKKDIKLPTSVAKKVPRETLVLVVTEQHIVVQGRKVADIRQVLQHEQDLIKDLEQELRFQATRAGLSDTSDSKPVSRAITIMGDENISYELLRKILATCRQVDYTQVAFAAMQKPQSGGQS